MSRVPRLLPLIGVAIGGVIAAHALQGARHLPDLLSSGAASAEEATPSKGRPAAPPTPRPRPVSSPASAPAGPGLPPVCAPTPAELAKAAGLSPAELNILQNLQARRGQIETREKDLDTEVQLLAAAEAKVDAKLRAMNVLKAEVQGLMSAADQKSQKDVDNLVVVYTKMKPGDAAAVMAQLDDRVRLPMAAAMKPQTLSAILGKMSPTEARILTERLAHRFAPLQAAVDAGKAQSPGKSPAASSDPAADPSGETAADPAAPAAAPPRHARRRVARAAAKPPAAASVAASAAPAPAASAPAKTG